MADQKKEGTRIAIKFGGASAGSAKKPAWPAPASTLGKRPRISRGFGGDESGSGSEDESSTSGRREQHITAFGANGAVLDKGEREQDERAKRAPLVIAKQPNRDWRAEARARRQKQQQPQSAGAAGAAESGGRETGVADQDKPIKWGLNLTRSGEGEEQTAKADESSDAAKHVGGEDQAGQVAKTADAGTVDSADKEAIDALLGRTVSDRTGTRLVIPGVADAEAPTEDDVFHRDFHDAPDTSTLEEYEAMPVEEFGAALLRGMGWDGKDRGPKIKQVKRRPNQMGLGAKELKNEEDLGAWNSKSTSSHRQRPPRLHEYRREQEKRREKREDRHRDSYKAERDREREHERDRRYGGGGGGDSSSHRHRDRDRR